MSNKEPSNLDPAPLHTPGALPFNADKYLEHVEDCEMTQAQKLEFLHTLWDIMSTFVRLGFGVDSVLPTLFQEASRNAADALEESVPTHEFNVAAEDTTGDKEN